MEENTPIKKLENKLKTEIEELEKAFMERSGRTTSQTSLRGSIGALEEVLEWMQELGLIGE